MLTVEPDTDQVILSFPRTRDLCLTPDAAEEFVARVTRAANYCEMWVTTGGRRTVLRGESRGALVRSWDGLVNIRFDTPTDREAVPYEAARRLAEEVRGRIFEARNFLTVDWRPNLIGG